VDFDLPSWLLDCNTNAPVMTVWNKVGRTIRQSVPAAQFLLHFRKCLANLCNAPRTQGSTTSSVGERLEIGFSFTVGIELVGVARKGVRVDGVDCDPGLLSCIDRLI
jgi:hypothetical protein